jgi:transposase
MNDLEIFASALELEQPWMVESVKFEAKGIVKELHIVIGYPKGSKFLYEQAYYSVYDHQYRAWRHLNFFQHECYIYARVPRVKTADGNVRLIEVPWADSGSSFTLMFEGMICELVKNGMGAQGCATQLDLDARRVFRILKRAVMDGIASKPLADVKELAIDETSAKKGHNYLTILSDRVTKKVTGVGIGKDKEAVYEALMEMEVRGADSQEVKTVTMDMSRSFIAAAAEYLPKSEIVFDRFHLSLNLNKAVDTVRKQEQVQFSELKSSKFIWLRNPKNLRENQKTLLETLSNTYTKIGQAYQLKEQFREVMDNAMNDPKLRWLNQWMKSAWASGIGPIQEFVNLLQTHWYGIKTYFKKKQIMPLQKGLI